MIQRNEIPVDLSGHLHGSAQQYDHKSTEQVVKVPESLPLKAVASVDQVSKVADLSSSPVQPSPTMSSKGAPFDMNQIPQALRQAVNRTVRSPHIHPGEQANEGSGISCLKGAANGDETKDLKLELTPGTSIEIFPDNGTIATVSEAPPQVAGLEQRTDGTLNGQPVDAGSHSVASEIKDKGVEDKQSSVATGSQHVTTQLIAELSKMWEENHVLSDSEIPRKDETSSNEGPSNEAMNATDIHAPSKQKNDHSTNSEG